MNYDELIDLGYDFRQINHMLKAQDLGYDFSKLSIHIPASIMKTIIDLKPEKLSADRIKILANCIKNRFDTSYVFDTTRYDINQVSEIVDSMYKKVNYKLVADPRLNANKMKAVKKALIAGIDEEAIKYINPSQLKKYLTLCIEAKKIGFDITKSLSEGYNAAQIQAFMRGHNLKIDIRDKVTPDFDSYQITLLITLYQEKIQEKKNYDIDKFIKKELTPKAIKTLFELMKNGLIIEELFSGDYNTNQINVIASAARNGHDYKILLNKNLSAEQMNMILCGLHAGFDVKVYAKPELQPSIMKLIFDNLKYNRDNPGKEIDIELLVHPEYKHQEVTHYAKILKTGTLDEKLEVIKRHNSLISSPSIKKDLIIR